MTKVFAIGWVALKRMLRDRSNIFFVFILPLAIILLVGIQFGGGGPTTVIGANPGTDVLSNAIVDRLASNSIEIEVLDDVEAMSEAVDDGELAAGVAFPEDLTDSIEQGIVPDIEVISTGPSSVAALVTASVQEVTSDRRVARVVAQATGVGEAEALAAIESVSLEPIPVAAEEVGDRLFPAGTGVFSVGASQQLVLFVFLTTLTGSAAIIQSRQLGVAARMLSTATSPTAVVVGEALGRFLVGVFQGIYIIGASILLFGVEWGNFVGAAMLLTALSAVGAGASMLLGTLFKNDQQAGGFSVMIGLGLAAIGGCMLPLELFPDGLLTAAKFTPQGWANLGFSELVYRDGGVADVLDETGILLAMAAVLLFLAGRRLRQVITRSS